ncbi:hypothetical protein BDQ12DRAFT_691917 [Crucibulum laeve]|uniref:Uncharacterized protein n=1 Tax=Crucibulum laeve TaxID=68775 RepID=A0A5C3LIE1_9AGAR|nr:hypothetical protein BDQ12DRAFT_691917 [Crucibulum laeve]
MMDCSRNQPSGVNLFDVGDVLVRKHEDPPIPSRPKPALPESPPGTHNCLSRVHPELNF